MSFRGRMAIALVALVLIGQAISWLAVNRALDAGAWREADERLGAGRQVVTEMLSVRAQQLEQSALLLASDFGFKGAVATGDEATIRSMAINHGARIGSDRFWILDLAGEVVFGLNERAGADSGEFVSLVKGASTRGASAHFATVDGTPQQIVLVPVMAPQLVGWAVLGFAMDQVLTTQLSELTGLDVSIVSAEGGKTGRSGSSSLPDLCFTELQQQGVPAPGAGVVRLSLAGHQFLTLREDFDPIVLLLHLDRDGVLENVYRLRAELAVILALTLAGSLLVALVMARTVTQPLQQLVSAARRIGRGDYSQQVPVGRADEVGSLALTLEQMRSGIAERERTIAYQAFHDALTELPNRARALQRLQSELGKAQSSEQPLALLMVDLDRFKEINDTLGHPTGDQALVQAARRLKQAFPEPELLARLGGDEFLVILPRTDSAGAESSAAILIETLALPQSLQGMQIMLDATVGIAAFPEHGDDPATLLARADIALNDAKSQNRRWSVYRPGRDQNQRDKLSLANDLRSALSRKELVLYYQPKLDLQRNQVIHAEALVRWIHPTRGFVPPDAFIALAEQTGRIRELTRWVLMTAIAQVRGWHQMGHRVGVAVNLSAHDLMDDGLPDYVQDLLHKFSVNPRELVLEVTESAVMRDAVYGMEMLHRLRALGIGLAIDDYGTGYSSLSYLKQLPVDEIKIDKSFVMNLDRDIDDAVIVRSTIDLGHNMGLQVVAEGVEDASSLERLRGFGCDLAQGYFISRPLPEAQMIEWLNQRRENEVPAGA